MAKASSSVAAHPESGSSWVGRSIARVEDSSLLTGRGRFMDDVGVHPGTLHAAFLRSPHAHADIISIDVSQAMQAHGVVAVLDGEDVKALTSSVVVGVKAPVECWPMRLAACAMSANPWRSSSQPIVIGPKTRSISSM